MTTPLAVEIVVFIEAQHALRPKTKHYYRGALERFDAFLGGGTLRDLNPKTVNAYISLKVSAGHPYLARNDMATLKVFAKWLVQAKHLKDNPLVSLAVPKVSQKGRAPFADRDIERIMDATQESRYPQTRARDHLIVMLALWTGLRLNELRNLQWPDDIDLREGSLHVRASKTDAGIRSVPLDDRIQSEIQAYVRSYRGDQRGPLFVNVNGQPLTYNGFARVQGRIHERLSSAGIDYKIHRMRNTWAAKSRAIGWDVLDIQQVGGWTDLAMVRRYAQGKSIQDLKRLPTMSRAYGAI
jgi:integrase